MMNSEEGDSTKISPFNPVEPALPTAFPIDNLAYLESRSYFHSFHYHFNKAKVRLPVNHRLKDQGRVLVCHDLNGGYLDDKWTQGWSNEDAYSIWHWHLIDVFVYFSHNLVTLPPPGWINAAHRHGVKVLGTIITEWDEGKIICDKLFLSKESAQMYAGRLVELAISLGFEGWLINIENNLDLRQIPHLMEFISHLTHGMHMEVPGSLVIWYDAVTIDGNLKWQDKLNECNKPFFDICDGIFVNYSWKEDYPGVSAAVAGERKFDVYMGIDVFGRGTYGGGQWNTNVALDLLKRSNVSAAIFAPGWVYETKQPPTFQVAQNRWWSLIEKSWCMKHIYRNELPFYSNFDQGRGHHFSVMGKDFSYQSWFNISSQGYQPLLNSVDSADAIEMLVEFKEPSFSGGGNITFKGLLDNGLYFSTPIFRVEILVEAPFHIIYSMKAEGNSALGILLRFSSPSGHTRSVLVARKWNPSPSQFDKIVTPQPLGDSNDYHGWVVLQGVVEMKGCKLLEISVMCHRQQLLDMPTTGDSGYPNKGNPLPYHAILGHIAILDKSCKPEFPPSTSWQLEVLHVKWELGPEESKFVCLELAWNLKNGEEPMFQEYNVYVEKLGRKMCENDASESILFLGVAHVECFYVADLHVQYGTSILKFIVQVCGADGDSQVLPDCPSFLLHTNLTHN